MGIGLAEHPLVFSGCRVLQKDQCSFHKKHSSDIEYLQKGMFNNVSFGIFWLKYLTTNVGLKKNYYLLKSTKTGLAVSKTAVILAE